MNAVPASSSSSHAPLADATTLFPTTTSIPFYIPGIRSSSGGGIAPDASILTASASTTVMALSCPPNVSEDECGWGDKEILASVINSNTYGIAYSEAGVRFDCTSSRDMTCTAMIATEFTDAGLEGYTAGRDGTATGTTVYKSGEVWLQTARVTGGLELLAVTTAVETGVASTTLKTEGSGSVKETGTVVSKTSASANGKETGTATGSAAPVEKTGAASRVGAALMAIVGAVLVYLL